MLINSSAHNTWANKKVNQESKFEPIFDRNEFLPHQDETESQYKKTENFQSLVLELTTYEII